MTSSSRQLKQLQVVASDAPPDPGLLADVVVALEAGRLPEDFAREEVCHLLRARPFVELEIRKRKARRVFAFVQARYPAASVRELARLTARRVGEKPDNVRNWVRGVGDFTRNLGEAQARKEP